MDNAHAHPQSPASALHDHVRSRSIPPSLRDSRTSHTTPKSAPHTRQQRLLQTRHARFSAQRISVNSITVPFPSLNRSVENDNPYFSSPRLANREEDGNTPERTRDLTSSSTRSSILDELTNSPGYRLHRLQKRAPIPVFQDNSGNSLTPAPGSQTPSVYHDATSNIQPSLTGDFAQDCSPTMGLREVSVNLHRTSPHKDSPYYRSLRSGIGRKSSHGKPRFNSEDYIEHIENELQMVKDSMYSPTTHVPWKDKLKKAKDESDRLRKELDSMRSSFELELQQTVERSTEIELRLKRKIKDLEDEVEHKQSVIQDLEVDRDEKRFDQNAMEGLKARIEKLEEEKASLETTNRDMTKRNEVLTHLLALSPTKTHPSIDSHTSRRRNARPMSVIIPRVPSSPDSQPSQGRPQSILVSPALAASDYFANLASSPLASSPIGMEPVSPRALDDSRSVNSMLGRSFVPASNDTHSRRSTLGSSASQSPELVPLGHSRTESRSQTLARYPSKRRPRKFMPGSTQLKPLLLPTFTADNGNLPSTSPMTSPNRPMSAMIGHETIQASRWQSLSSSRRFDADHGETHSITSSANESGQPGPAFQSLDEAFSKDAETQSLGHQAFDNLCLSNRVAHYGTSVQNSLTDSASSIASLDNLNFCDPLGSWGVDMTPAPTTDHDRTAYEIGELRHGDDYGYDYGYDGTLSTTLHSRLDDPSPGHMHDNVEFPRPLFHSNRVWELDTGQSSSLLEYPESSANRRKRRKGGPSGGIDEAEHDVVNANSLDPPLHSAADGQTFGPSSVKRRPQTSLKQQPSLSRKRLSTKAGNPLQLLQQRRIGSRPLATLTIQAVYATLSRYTSYIKSFKRDPLALARRVIANAWRSNWARFGKLSWWVLGLFIGYRYSGPVQGPDWDKYDGESIAHQCRESPVDDASFRNTAERSNGQGSRAFGEQSRKPTMQATDPRSQTITPESPPKEPKIGWGKSLFLWGKFSVAIMLAVGGAIVNGPAEMLRETEDRRRSQNYGETEAHEAQDTTKPGPRCEPCHVNAVPELVGQGKQDRKENYSHAENPPGAVRKARSLSSPLPSPGTHHFTNIDAGQSSLKDDRGAPGYTETLRNQLPTEQLSSMDETLKPSRSARRGWEEIFQVQNDQTPRPSQSVVSVALSDNVLYSHTRRDRQKRFGYD